MPLLEMARIILLDGPDAYKARKAASVPESAAIMRRYELVKDPLLKQTLEVFEQTAQLESLVIERAMPAAMTIGEFAGLTSYNAARLYENVRRRGVITFVKEKLHGRVLHFTSEGARAFFALARESSGGFWSPSLVRRTREKLGEDPLKNELHDFVQSHDGDVVAAVVKIPVLPEAVPQVQGIDKEESDGFDQQPANVKKQQSVLKKIPEFTAKESTTLATWNRLKIGLLRETHGMDLDTITFPADRFPVAQAIILIEAAVTSDQERTWEALEEFDSSLEDLTRRQWNYAIQIVCRLFEQYPQYEDLGHLFRANVRWIKERAAEHIKEREELQP